MRQIFALSKVLSKLGLKSEQYQLYSIARKSDNLYIYFADKIAEKISNGDRERYLAKEGDDFYFGFRVVIIKNDIGEDLLEEMLGFIPTNFLFELYLEFGNPEKFDEHRRGQAELRVILPMKKTGDSAVSPGYYEIMLIPTEEDVKTGNLREFVERSVRTSMYHEVAHIINSIRKGISVSEKNKKITDQNKKRPNTQQKDLEDSSQEYADSRDEVQARLIETIVSLKRYLDEEIADPSHGSIYSELLASIKEGNVSKFINTVFDIFSEVLQLKDIYDEPGNIFARKVSDDVVKLYKKRLGDVYQEYRDKLEMEK